MHPRHDAVTEPLAIAFAHHQAGRLAQAEAAYRRVLASTPDNVAVMQLLAVLSLAGRSDFGQVKAGISLRGRGLVFMAFDLMFLDGKDLRALPVEERRAELRRMIPRSPKSRLQFSEAIAGSGAEVFASAERLGLEGIVSKRLGSVAASIAGAR
jgi:ATP-dependent DNA ligase